MPKQCKSESHSAPKGKANANPNGAAMTKTDVYPLDTIADFKWWYIQKPNAAKLLKEIIYRWRGSGARVTSKTGKWAVYARSEWQDWTGLSRNQFERALKHLDDMGLIERERHRFAGTTVRVYIRPTQLALTYAGRPSDVAPANVLGSVQEQASAGIGEGTSEGTGEGIGEGTSEGTGEGIGEGTSEGTSEGTGEGIGEGTSEGTDYTTLPFPSKKSTKQQEGFLNSKGKGSAKGEDSKLSSPEKSTPPIPPSSADELNCTGSPTPSKAKVLKGAHEKHIKHPSKLYPDWNTFSSAAKSNLQAKYEGYVANWYVGKKGKPYAALDHYDDIEWPDWSDDPEESLEAFNAKEAAKVSKMDQAEESLASILCDTGISKLPKSMD